VIRSIPGPGCVGGGNRIRGRWLQLRSELTKASDFLGRLGAWFSSAFEEVALIANISVSN
jgi:hypothetical protein